MQQLHAVCVLVFLFAVTAIMSGESPASQDYLDSQLQGPYLEKRRARELLGKRNVDQFARETRPARELWGKRSVPDYLVNPEEHYYAWIPQSSLALVNKRVPHDIPMSAEYDDKLYYLMSMLNNKRERRARTTELLG